MKDAAFWDVSFVRTDVSEERVASIFMARSRVSVTKRASRFGYPTAKLLLARGFFSS
jgi:hypothetical protein